MDRYHVEVEVSQVCSHPHDVRVTVAALDAEHAIAKVKDDFGRRGLRCKVISVEPI